MKKIFIFLPLFFITILAQAQVGVNTTNPNAQLDIRSSNQATPTNTDGILIPKVDAFPATNPTAAQQGMLVYLTTTSGADLPGFYYWDNATVDWKPIAGNSGGTLDQAYDFGGAGLGRTITADTGAVLINGTDGLVSTGTTGTGVVAPSGGGTKMFWNPRKAAFRTGQVFTSKWDDVNIGSHSVAFGLETQASGDYSTAFGVNTYAIGEYSTAFGSGSSANGERSIAFGSNTSSSGYGSTSFGNGTTASSQSATSFGSVTTASGAFSTSFGFATTASGQSATSFGSFTTASGENATSFGAYTTASGANAISFGEFTSADGNRSTAFGSMTIASGNLSTAFGEDTRAVGDRSTAFGYVSVANGRLSTVSGLQNTAESYGETVMGIGATSYTPSLNGATQFRSANATDRLFVIGNAIDTNNNNFVDGLEQSDAMIVLKNGLTRLPSTTNAMITAADGKAVVTKEYLQSNTSGTLDQAYDFGGAGLGKTISADAGAVTINGTDGLVSTGTYNSGALAPSGGATKMVWNPRKAAFRAGRVFFNEWDDTNIGYESVAFGSQTKASGSYSSAFGWSSEASGIDATAFGLGTKSANAHTFAAGYNTQANGILSTVFGDSGIAPSYGETVLGIGATTYTPSSGGNINFQAGNVNDRLFVIGNAIDANANFLVENSERSDAMIVLKNGLTRLPSTTNAMITAADGKAVVTKEYLQSSTSGTLDQAYDFGGVGLGRTITADTGAVTINGTDGLVSTGTLATGSLAPSGAGDRMVWNPRKGAFRAGNVNGTEWDDVNVGYFSVAFGQNNRATAPGSFSTGDSNLANGSASSSFGQSTSAVGSASVSFGQQSYAAGDYSAAFGRQSSTGAAGLASFSSGQNTGANAPYSAAFGYWSSSSGESSFVAGRNSAATGYSSVCLGESNFALGSNSLATGELNSASGSNASVFGYNNVALSFGETVFGIGATTYTPSVNGNTQFRAANAADRLFVIGNAIDANNNDLVDVAEQRDAMVVLKNGNTGFGISTPLNRLHIVGNIRMVDGTQAAGRVLTSDVNGVATWQNASANAWGLLGNAGTNATTNFLGTTDNVDLVFRRNNSLSGRIGATNIFLGLDSGLVNTGNYNTFIGPGAGSDNATGSDNTFIGRLAGAFGVSGNDNSYLGYAAGMNNTGNSNLILGAFASQNTTGNFNVFVGNQSGGTNTTGSRNTVLGFNAEVGAGNLTNATAIGSNSQVDTSNSLVLGSILGVNSATASTNVGIGTTSPLTRLEILDDNNVTSSTARGNLHITATNPQAIDIGASITLGGYNDDAASIMRVFGSIEGRKTNSTTTSSSGYLAFKTNNAGILAERMRITNAGNVGIGGTNPGGLFEIGLDQGRKPGTSTWTIVSDARLKTINGNYTKGLNEILQLHPIRFNYKNNEERVFEKEVLDTEYPGFIAQEVQPLFPDAVGTDADGFLNFNIHPILIASVNAIKELNAKNESLQTENESLKTELNQQKAQLELVMQRLSALEKK